MRFRLKIIVLLICLSIVPIVALRAFGIHNVRLFAEEVRSQVEVNSRKSAELRFGAIVQTHRQSMVQTLQKLEMALLFQAYEASRLLVSETVCRDGDAGTEPSDRYDTVLAAAPSGDDGRHHCILSGPVAESGPGAEGTTPFRELAPAYQTIGDQLGALVLRHYTASGPWADVFPVDPGQCRGAWPAAAAKDFAVLEERFSYWSAPYTDPVSERPVAALTLPLTCPDETVVGWTGIVVDLERLLDAAVGTNGLREGAWAFIGTLVGDAAGGVGIAPIVHLGKDVSAGASDFTLLNAGDFQFRPGDDQYRRILHDFLRLRTNRHQVVLHGRESYWAFSPIPHQGTGLVLVVPMAQPSDRRQAMLETIDRRTRRVELLTAAFLVLLVIVAIMVALTFSKIVTKPLEKLTRAAQKLAAGDLKAGVAIDSKDEIGSLASVFNRIGPDLSHAYAMRRSVEVASKIQEHLLPHPPPIDGFDIFGLTLYSNLAGGDYYDFLCDEADQGRLCVAIGDVSGHGVSSALLMASVRSALRMRARMSGTMSAIAESANAVFSEDVEASGNFVTLFLARLDRNERLIQWIRAGHDPALLYDPAADRFTTLKGVGKGLPFGINTTEVYLEESHPFHPGQIFFLGTDGIWEARDARGAFFGKQRIKQILRENADADAKMIVTAVMDAVEAFQAGSDPSDDITCVVVKFTD